MNNAGPGPGGLPSPIEEVRGRINTACLLILTAIAVTVTLMYLRAVMVPFVLAVFLYFMVYPAVNYLQLRLRVSRAISVTLTLFIGLGSTSLIVFIVSASLVNFFQGAEFYEAQLLDALEAFEDWIAQFEWIRFDPSRFQDQIEAFQIISLLRTFTGGFMGVVGNFLLILVFLVFLLAGQVSVATLPEVVREVYINISRYILTKFLVSAITGALVAGILSAFRLDLALMFGFLAFLLNFIPNIGSIIATLLPVPVAFLQFGWGYEALSIILLPGIVQFSVGNIIEPKLLGMSLDLHPVAILFFLFFWAIVWGIPGMFLAVPITSVLKIVMERFDETRPAARLLSGRVFQVSPGS